MWVLFRGLPIFNEMGPIFLDLFLLGDFLRIVKWDSSPVNHHLGEDFLHFFPSAS